MQNKFKSTTLVTGNKKKIKYWGVRTIAKFVELDNPIVCYNKEQGRVYFDPKLVKIKWDKAPSKDKHDLWLTYWLNIGGRNKFGQYGPMIGQKALLELLTKAIKADFFEKNFLKALKENIEEKLKAGDTVSTETENIEKVALSVTESPTETHLLNISSEIKSILDTIRDRDRIEFLKGYFLPYLSEVLSKQIQAYRARFPDGVFEYKIMSFIDYLNNNYSKVTINADRNTIYFRGKHYTYSTLWNDMINILLSVGFRKSTRRGIYEYKGDVGVSPGN